MGTTGDGGRLGAMKADRRRQFMGGSTGLKDGLAGPQIVSETIQVIGARSPGGAPEPITGSADIVDLNVRRSDLLGGILHEYENAA